MLTVALIVAVIYLYRTTQKNKQVALNKGIGEKDFMRFTLSLWLYLVPSVAIFFVDGSDIIVTAVLVSLFVPGIVLSKKISAKLDRGYDYEKRAGREFDKAFWLGFAGIGLVIISWGLISVQSWLNSRQAP